MSPKVDDASRMSDKSDQPLVARAGRCLLTEVRELFLSLQDASDKKVQLVHAQLSAICQAMHVEEVPASKRAVESMGKVLEKRVRNLVKKAGDDPATAPAVRDTILNAVRTIHGGRPLSDEEISSERSAILQKYQVEALGNCGVQLTLKAGMSRLDFIREANLWALAGIGQPGVQARTLRLWEKDPLFTRPVSVDTVIGIGCVPNSGNRTDEEQKSRGWNTARLTDLAAGHQAFLMVTGGTDMFDHLTVRGLEGALIFNMYGLRVDDISPEARSQNIIASQVLLKRLTDTE